MPRYIDADELLKALDSDDSLKHARRIFSAYVKEQPTADVAPVVHGEWKYNADHGEYRCTNCNEWGAEDDELTHCCPNCGAKMDGGKG